MMKKFLVLVAALAMVFSLTACGESYPQEYTYTEPRGEGESTAVLKLTDDKTYEYTFTSTNSNGDGGIAMTLTFTGNYTKDGDTVTFETMEGEGYYMVGSEQTDFSITKEEVGMYKMAYGQGAMSYTLDGDTFVPAE